MLLRRYDLCEQAASKLWVDLVIMNIGYEWSTSRDAIDGLTAVVMATREVLDRAKVAEMIEAIWEANN